MPGVLGLYPDVAVKSGPPGNTSGFTLRHMLPCTSQVPDLNDKQATVSQPPTSLLQYAQGAVWWRQLLGSTDLGCADFLSSHGAVDSRLYASEVCGIPCNSNRLGCGVKDTMSPHVSIPGASETDSPHSCGESVSGLNLNGHAKERKLILGGTQLENR